MIYKDLPCIISDSKNTIYKFWLDSSSNLNVENYNKSDFKSISRFTYKNSILDYSVDVDDLDRIHIIYVTKDGVLKYSMLNYPNMDRTISSTPSKEYSIDYVTIKIIYSNIHIFYMTQNKYNPNYCSINHCYLQNNVWNSQKLDELPFIKKSIPYSIDFYKNNIYIFYPTKQANQYSIKKFNVSFNIWSTVENDLTLINCQNADLFINSSGTGIICYMSSIGRNSNTLIKFKDFNISGSIWSDGFSVRNANYELSLPSVLCRSDALFLFWKDSNAILLKKCPYESSSLDEERVPFKDVLYACNYISNKSLPFNSKSNFLFFSNIKPNYNILYHDAVKEFLKFDPQKSEQKFNPLNGPLKETLKIITKNTNSKHYDSPLVNNSVDQNKITLNNCEDLSSSNDNIENLINFKQPSVDHLVTSLNLKETEIEDLKHELTSKNEQLEQIKIDLNLKLAELEQLNNTISSKSIELEELNTNLTLEHTRLLDIKNNLALKDKELETNVNSIELKDAEIQKLSSSYTLISNLLEEKELLIQELNNKIEKLELEIKNKNYESFETKKKRSFLDLFKI